MLTSKQFLAKAKKGYPDDPRHYIKHVALKMGKNVYEGRGGEIHGDVYKRLVDEGIINYLAHFERGYITHKNKYVSAERAETIYGVGESTQLGIGLMTKRRTKTGD